MAGTFLDDRQIVNRAALSALGNTANLTLDVIMGDINTFFANASASAVPSVLMLRDANANTRANNFIEGFTTTATAAGTTTLTVASTYFQQFTGSTSQIVALPDATTLVAGQSFLIANRSTGYVTVNANGGTLVQLMASGSQTVVTVTNIGTSAGTWDSSYSVAGPVPFLRTNVTTDSTTTGSASTLLTGDILFGDVRLTNASLVSVSGIPAGASGQQIIVENQTGNTITINNNDAGATAANRIFTGTGGAVTMSANASFEFVYDSTASRWMLVGGTGSGSGSGGSKNYLSVYTASTSSGVPNVGNGNWELGSTSGWTLAHSTLSSFFPTSVATAGSAFSSSSGGSAASGNLSLSTVTSGTQISGTYSGALTSSAASTAGDLLISNSFFIDKEDQAKVLTFKAYYQAATVGGLNFSGTSSNGFAVYIYDVTNGAWIQPAGVYGMTQNSGSGYVTGTFQSTVNSTQYQLAFVNINASTGAYTVYFDDISVGPQTAPIGSVMTDWQNYTPTITGFGTPTNVGFKSRRVGDTLEVFGFFQSGTPTAVTAQITLGYQGGNSNVVIDTTKISTTSIVGTGGVGASSATYFGLYPLVTASNSILELGVQTSSANAVTPANANSIANSGNFVVFEAKVPIVGWSSNTQMSNDTDTRVVSAQMLNGSPTAVTANAVITSYVTQFDTHGALSSGVFTAPVAGFYTIIISTVSRASGAGNTVSAYVNGVLSYSLVSFNGATGSNVNLSGSAQAKLKAGDTVDIRCDGSITIIPGYVTFNRLAGPSVIAATESVNASYTTAAGQSIPTGSATTVVFGTKAFDSHGAMNASTGVYTVPVSGKYLVTGGLYTATAVTATDTDNQLQLLKNSSLYQATNNPKPGATAAPLTCAGSFLASCNAGDTLALAMLQTSGASQTLIASAAYNFFNVCRVGN